MDFESEVIEQYRLFTEWRDDLTVHKSRHNNGTEETWQRQRCIGQGGFGTVWLEARNDESNKQRAVKEVKKPTGLSPNNDYRRELLALVKLSPKYRDRFVDFQGWFQDKITIYYAMEYFPLGDLDQHLSASGILEDAARQVTHQILIGLAFMHKNSFTHRDLKPKNIFVVGKEPWHVKIGDFGISKRVNDETVLHTSIFSFGYDAPEIEGSDRGIRGENGGYTNAVDMWSLGCVVYKMLTGKIPFPSRDQQSDFYHSQTLFPTDPLLAKEVSRSARNFVQALIKPDPSDRPGAQAALKLPWIPITDSRLLEEIERDEGITQRVAHQSLSDSEDQILKLLGKTDIARFLKAAATGNNQAINILRDRGVSINTESAFGRTALHEAASHGQNSTIELLLRIPGVNKEIRDKEGNTPLLAAAWAAHFTSLEILLLHDANPRVVNNAGACALHATAKLSEAYWTRALLQKSVPASLAQNTNKITPLHYAAAHGSVEIMKILLEYDDVELDVQDDKGWTALHYAARFNHNDCALFLLQEKDYFYFQKVPCDYNPLGIALSWNSSEVINSLLQHLTNVSARKRTMSTEFNDAIRHRRTDVAQRLIDLGVDVNSAEESTGKTPLHLAVEVLSVTFIRTLLENGADPLTKDMRGYSAWDKAREKGPHIFNTLTNKWQRMLVLRPFLQDLDRLAKLGERVTAKCRGCNSSGELARLTNLIEKLARIICAWNADMRGIPIADFEDLGFFDVISSRSVGPGYCRSHCVEVLEPVLKKLEMNANYYSEKDNLLAESLSRSRNRSKCRSIEKSIENIRLLYASFSRMKMASRISNVFWGEIEPTVEAS